MTIALPIEKSAWVRINFEGVQVMTDELLLRRISSLNEEARSVQPQTPADVLNLSLTGNISIVPEDFFPFGELFFPSLSTEYRNQAPEFFAHCFSMGITSRPEFQQYDAFPTIELAHKRLFDAYMKAKIASLPRRFS